MCRPARYSSAFPSCWVSTFLLMIPISYNFSLFGDVAQLFNGPDFYKLKTSEKN